MTQSQTNDVREKLFNYFVYANAKFLWTKTIKTRDEDPDPVGSVDFWPAESGSGTFFNGSGSYL